MPCGRTGSRNSARPTVQLLAERSPAVLHTVWFLASFELGLAKVKHVGNFDAVLVALFGLLAIAATAYFAFQYFG